MSRDRPRNPDAALDPHANDTVDAKRPQDMAPGKQTTVPQLPGRPMQFAAHGKQTLTEQLPGPPTQFKAAAPADGRPGEPPRIESGGGQPLPGDLRVQMERSMGEDFSSVRVHQGKHVNQMGALALTQGDQLHFAPGQYQPGSSSGDQLIGHELAHVKQQRQGRVAATTQAKGVAVNNDTGLEAEADTWGSMAAHGEPLPGVSVTVATGAEATQMSALRDGSAVQLKAMGAPIPVHRGATPSGVVQMFEVTQSLGEGHDEVKFELTEQLPVGGRYQDDGYVYEEKSRNETHVTYERRRLSGAVAVYRGLHFKATWSPEKYQEELNKIVVGTPTFSSAAWEIAIRVARTPNPTTEQLEEAAAAVDTELDQMRDFQDKDKPGNLNKYQHRDGGTRPREDGEDEHFTRKGRRYLNQFAAALSLYINNQKEFEKNLAKAEGGDFGARPFVTVPFISTSKSATQAAKYAKGKVQPEADVRTAGTVGRMYVYVAPLERMRAIGAVDVVESHPNEIYICEWRFGEQEVTYMGSIPGDFLVAQDLVQAGEDDGTVAGRAETLAAQHAAPHGGLKDYTTR